MPRRVLLTVPYAEKDKAKAHGARWDAVLRKWWVSPDHLAKHPALNRWIVHNPELRAEAKAMTKERQAAARAPKVRKRSLGTPVTTAQTTLLLPSCDCPVAPWEACKHTATDGQASLARRATSDTERLQHERRRDPTPALPVLVTWKSSRLGSMVGAFP